MKDRRRISAPPAKSVWGNRSAQEKTSALRESEPSARAGQIRDEIQKLVAEIATLLVWTAIVSGFFSLKRESLSKANNRD
ncbi:hypothetical protein [Sphingosinicella xenopeptidilytica]|uniref:Uncharacterized protein n=1 Tax=Sphingosinicella xenopeptidilytica TaxID=364098 RepID=A0ABW3C1B4_SPHXN